MPPFQHRLPPRQDPALPAFFRYGGWIAFHPTHPQNGLIVFPGSGDGIALLRPPNGCPIEPFRVLDIEQLLSIDGMKARREYQHIARGLDIGQRKRSFGGLTILFSKPFTMTVITQCQ
ncbi:hypothetical protein A6M27_18970 [Acidithiobacillus thiooxidans]|uniref:Uncharacterized protein n=1 Tax=Acidithiobacillus thiooxidans TaxID=930 RepID=A0A1C2I0J0_ACITH|nr:hypothetical protein A6O24_19240 [Acidithiobacillus thiooxidans]OCX69502.1 hypothetical protein A6P07_16400 [Acidithiobacillus thiooxidans]OCX81776.1 hypothetical protein A6O26_12090 [Acidithiobacillus thiooxidans]OCX82285.1 hypothetical protein A6M27_18970 [Acidithiobacillus thiooxidans]OFC51005.1 hypothetical protein BAE47_00660 [Acidithiobacillus thiooxidans]